MQIKVTVGGYGMFEVEEDKIPELISWLSSYKAVSIKEKNQVVKEVLDSRFTGRELITENL